MNLTELIEESESDTFLLLDSSGSKNLNDVFLRKISILWWVRKVAFLMKS